MLQPYCGSTTIPLVVGWQKISQKIKNCTNDDSNDFIEQKTDFASRYHHRMYSRSVIFRISIKLKVLNGIDEQAALTALSLGHGKRKDDIHVRLFPRFGDARCKYTVSFI